MIENKFSEVLEVILTEKEIREKSEENNKRVLELAELKAAKKRSDEAYTSRIKLVTQESEDIARVLEAGKERRPVDCEWLPDLDTREMVARRLDTYHALRRRPMNADERREYFQQKLWEIEGEKKEQPVAESSEVLSGDIGGTPFPTEYSQAEINRMADFYCGDAITREEPVRICYILEQPHVIVEVTGVTDPTSVKACSILPIENVTEEGAEELRAKGDFYLGKKINCHTTKNPQWWVIVAPEQSLTVAPSADQDASQEDGFTAPRCDECKRTDGGHAQDCSQSDSLAYDDYFAYAQSQGKKNPASFARKMEVTCDPKVDETVRQWKKTSGAQVQEAMAGGQA